MHIPPLVFQNGDELYSEFQKKYKTHDEGLFILAPSGAGKTHFCTHQTEQNWIDGDELWMAAGAHPDGPWWTQPIEVINRVDNRSDVITMEAKALGFWIMGASNLWLKPDAIVIPDWEAHIKYIKHREETNYDGGATSEGLAQVQDHISVIKKWNSEHGVPMFKTIEEAVEALTSNSASP